MSADRPIQSEPATANGGVPTVVEASSIDRVPSAAELRQDERARSIPTVIIASALGGVAVGVFATLMVGQVIMPAITSASEALGPTAIVRATSACGIEDDPWITIGDDGHSLSMQSEGAENDGADILDVACVLAELDTPDSVISRIDSTRALDGRQSAEWDDLAASWGYHPDNGLDLVVETTTD